MLVFGQTGRFSKVCLLSYDTATLLENICSGIHAWNRCHCRKGQSVIKTLNMLCCFSLVKLNSHYMSQGLDPSRHWPWRRTTDLERSRHTLPSCSWSHRSMDCEAPYSLPMGMNTMESGSTTRSTVKCLCLWNTPRTKNPFQLRQFDTASLCC